MNDEQGEIEVTSCCAILDAISDSLVVPNGTMGQRWEEGKKWELKTRKQKMVLKLTLHSMAEKVDATRNNSIPIL